MKVFKSLLIGSTLGFLAFSSMAHAAGTVTLNDATVTINTTSNDKDDNTRVQVKVLCDGGLAALGSNEQLGADQYFDDGQTGSPRTISILQGFSKDRFMSGLCSAQLEKIPSGNDRWEFNSELIVRFSDGTTAKATMGIGSDRSQNGYQNWGYSAFQF